MSRSIAITQNEHFSAAVCVQVNFLHDITGLGAIRLLEECSKNFSATVTLIQAGRKQPQNDMVHSAFYTVTPRSAGDVTKLMQALAKSLASNQLVQQAWGRELDVKVRS